MNTWVFFVSYTNLNFTRNEMVVETYTVPTCVIVAVNKVNVPLGCFYLVRAMSLHTAVSDS